MLTTTQNEQILRRFVAEFINGGDEAVLGDTTVLDFALSGTHRGEFMGIPATDRPFDFRGVVISRYRDGRIASEWEIMDTMTLLQQLGAA